MTAAVLADGLAVGYEGVAVVQGIDLRVAPGSRLALVGTNGSGKSTLLRTLVGLLRPVDGRLEVLGAAPGRRPGGLGYLSQFHHDSLALPVRARDVVRTGRFADRGLLGRITADDEGLVDEALERMGIAALARRPLRDLSGGQRQRAYLAQVLARRADLLVLDEPTAGLDAVGRDTYLRALDGEQTRGAAVVVATHDIGEARLADQVLLLAGRVVALGPPAQVLTAEHLLATFGIGIESVGGELVVTEHPHGHDHHGHDH